MGKLTDVNTSIESSLDSSFLCFTMGFSHNDIVNGKLNISMGERPEGKWHRGTSTRNCVEWVQKELHRERYAITLESSANYLNHKQYDCSTLNQSLIDLKNQLP